MRLSLSVQMEVGILLLFILCFKVSQAALTCATGFSLHDGRCFRKMGVIRGTWKTRCPAGSTLFEFWQRGVSRGLIPLLGSSEFWFGAERKNGVWKTKRGFGYRVPRVKKFKQTRAMCMSHRAGQDLNYPKACSAFLPYICQRPAVAVAEPAVIDGADPDVTNVETPVNAVMSPWSEWTACSQSCGPEGTTQRSRTCDSEGQNGGTMCDEMSIVDGPNPCNTETPCPIDAVVSPWSDWTACSKPCGPDGTTQRTRTCSSDGQNGGTMCDQMGLVDGPNPCNTDFDGKSALKSKQWGQGNCKYDNQFDCQQDPYGLSDNTCIDKTQLCNGHRDCSWMDTSQASWDEDPEWCKCFKGDSLSEDEQDNDGNDDDDEDEEQDEDDEEDEQEEDDGDDDEDENDQTKAKGNWGQGDCKYDNQFDCRQDPYGPSDNTCIDKSQRCDGKRDCLWKDTSRDSWDEDPAWCATLHDSDSTTEETCKPNSTSEIDAAFPTNDLPTKKYTTFINDPEALSKDNQYVPGIATVYGGRLDKEGITTAGDVFCFQKARCNNIDLVYAGLEDLGVSLARYRKHVFQGIYNWCQNNPTQCQAHECE